MKPLAFYKTLSIVLLALNLVMIGLFIWRKPPPPKANNKGKGFLHHAQKMLKLDEQQNAQFLQMAHYHKSQMDSIQQLQSQYLLPWFQNVLKTNSEEMSHQSLDRLGQLEQQKIEITYQHFTALKSILKSTQLDDFERFMEKALKNILLQPKNNRPPPKDF